MVIVLPRSTWNNRSNWSSVFGWVLAEMEFDRVADAVDGSVEIHPSSADLDVGFIDMPFSGDGALAPIETLQKQRREMNDPAVDCRMIDADAALGHHFPEITQAQSVRQIPTNAKQNDGLVEMAAFKHQDLPGKQQGPMPQPAQPRVCNRTIAGAAPGVTLPFQGAVRRTNRFVCFELWHILAAVHRSKRRRQAGVW